MQYAPATVLLADTSAYAIIGILLMLLIVATIAILVMTHLVGPSRKGPIKDAVYESGMDPIGDTRKRFNVRFYIVAMLFLLFDVEIVFFYPWATLFPRLTTGPDLPDEPTAAQLSQAGFESMPQVAADYHTAGYEQYASVFDMTSAGFGGGFLLIEMFIFIGILLVGYVYAWRKGAFQWN